MERNRKEALALYFKAPEPKGKRAFIRKVGHKRISILQMLLLQLSYLPKWTWCLFGAALAGVHIVGQYTPERVMVSAFALLPFLSMLVFVESMRSMTYHMEELEMAARFSLKSVVIARMAVLGGGSLVFVFVLAVFLQNGILQNICHLLVPYLITASGGLAIVRRFPTKDGTYFCGGYAAIVSAITSVVIYEYQWIFESRYLIFWMIAIGVLVYTTIREGYRTIRMTEELAWNW